MKMKEGIMAKGLKFALRQEIFPTPPFIHQEYPFNKNFLQFFVEDFLLRESEELDDDDRALLAGALDSMRARDFHLSPQHQAFYNGVIETLFRQQEELGPREQLSDSQLKECRKWAESDLIKLKATQETAELFLFDLFLMPSSSDQRLHPDLGSLT